MITLYLVRHGETIWNVQKRMQGRKDSDLTEKGLKQAKLLADRLANTDFIAVYTSPSGRTVRTAQIISSQKNLPIIKDDRLMEIDLGNFEGLNQEQFKRKNAEQLCNFWTNPKIYIPDGGEKFEQVRNRAISFINDIKHKYDSGNILIITHTVTIKLIMGYFEKRPIEKIWEGPYIYQTSLSKIELNDDKSNITLYGDTSHLGDTGDIESM